MNKASRRGFAEPVGDSSLRAEGRIIARSVLWILAVTIPLISLGMWSRPPEFDPVRWHATRVDRADQAYGLILRRELKGLSREEVLALLGPGAFGVAWDPWELLYDLGSDDGDSDEVLVIRFHEFGIVAEARIVRNDD